MTTEGTGKLVIFSLSAILRLIRIGNLLILVATQYLVRIFLVGPKSEWKSQITDPVLFTLALSTAFIAAAGYIINDYYDVKIDTINKPQRVVFGTKLKRRVGIWGHILLNFAGIIMGFSINWQVGVVHFMAGFLLWAYSNQLKRTMLWGNIAISGLAAASVLVVSLVYHDHLYLVLTYATFAFFINLIREIYKDIEDRKGDKAFGCRTLPIVKGIRKSKEVAITLIIFFGLLLMSMVSLGGIHHLWAYLLAILGMLAILLYRSYRADTTAQFKGLSRWCKVIMIVGLGSMVFI